MTTLGEYLKDVDTIEYELSVIADGDQVFVHEVAERKAQLEDTVRYGNLSAPKGLQTHETGNGWASFWLGDAQLVVWKDYAHTGRRE